MAENENKETLTPEQNRAQEYLEYFKKRLDYSKLTTTIVQDLINNRQESVLFKRYSKEEIVKCLSNPQNCEKQIRDMSCYLYENSTHYKRLSNYFSKLPTYNYTIVPYGLKPEGYNKKSFLLNYRKVADLIEKFNLKYHLAKIFNICMYQDIFCGLYYETENSFDITHINADYCRVSSKIDGCLVYSLNFDFFRTRLYLLDSYGEAIKTMYYNYVGHTEIDESGNKRTVKGDKNFKWQEPPNQICIKVNDDQLLYSLPPFAGIFPEILNLEDYKLLKKTGEMLDRYKVLAMNLPLNEDGTFQLDKGLAEEFYNQAAKNIDDSIGLILSPMKIDKFDFQNSRAADSDAVNEAESALWSASGSNGALFGSGDKLSSSSLKISINNDETIIFSMLRQFENWINSLIKSRNLPYGFKVKYINQSSYNETEVCSRFKEAATYGVTGSRSLYAASLGLSPSDVLYMTDLEKELDFINTWVPMQSSNTLPAGEGGRPTQEQVDDSGEKTREGGGNVENR